MKRRPQSCRGYRKRTFSITVNRKINKDFSERILIVFIKIYMTHLISRNLLQIDLN